jgi:hypothetical protein
MNASAEGRRDGSAEGGGINWYMLVETSYLRLHPTWIFDSFVHQARALQTCWRIPHLFRSLSTTYVVISMSAKKMKRDYFLHSNGAIVSAVSTLQMAVPNLRKLVMANEEFPILERLIYRDSCSISPPFDISASEALKGSAVLQNSNSAPVHYLLVGGVGICTFQSHVWPLLWASCTVWLRFFLLPISTVTNSRPYSPSGCSFAHAPPRPNLTRLQSALPLVAACR